VLFVSFVVKNGFMTTRATGSFDVKVAPLPAPDAGEGSLLGRMSLDKRFHGDLDGTSKGEMLTAGTGTKESAVYVAVERVIGTLDGRRGSFSLHHTGIMTRGATQLTILVVPDSGDGDLAGLSGTMTIKIVDKQHYYEFDYSLP